MLVVDALAERSHDNKSISRHRRLQRTPHALDLRVDVRRLHANEQGAPPGWVQLVCGEVVRESLFVGNALIEGILGNADDHRAWPLRQTGRTIPDHLDALAEWILAGPQGASHRFADDDTGRR